VKEMQRFVIHIDLESYSGSRRKEKGKKFFTGGIVPEITIRCIYL
jgi:hypothetical protein